MPSININNFLINQNLNGILPFTFTSEDKFQADLGNSALLKFSFKTSNETYLDYTNINTPTTTNPTTTTTYIPETDDSKYIDSPIFYVDLIVEDKSGISKVSTRPELNRRIKSSWRDR